ncbi:hypothetical protein [Pseudomonas oryzihabitans]|uniref:hypothetical protein n=1 Tax=Pseudomonas oryzihabitans TaxID=47885 RepID=UPI0011A71FA6|nr:hypothetical protein [Pseudomonas psychrotolerans]
MYSPALQRALGALAGAFPRHVCQAERSTSGLIRIVLHLRSGGRPPLGWTTTDGELTNPAALARMVAHMQAALRQRLDGAQS